MTCARTREGVVTHCAGERIGVLRHRQLLPANLVMSNVSGPPVALYLAGRTLADIADDGAALDVRSARWYPIEDWGHDLGS